jgi:Xaa-Pro aminopeptidase
MHTRPGRLRPLLIPRIIVSGAAVLAAALTAAPAAAQRMERFSDWTRPVFPAAEYVTRRGAALAALGGDEVLLVPSAEGTSGGETFRQLDDFEYFVGLELPRSVLAIDARSRRATLFVPRTDPRFENPGRPNDFPGRELLGDPSLRTLSGVDTVVAFDAFGPFVAQLVTRRARVLVDRGRAGAEVEWPSMPFASPSPGDAFVAHLRRTHPGLAVANAYTLIAGLRMIKSPAEIARLREAARVTSIAIARGAARVRPGIDERALSGAFTADCLALGAQRDAFSPIIKAGRNSLWPWRILGAHYDRRNQPLRPGELVIFDVGCERDHYVSDVGRTFPVDTLFTPLQRELVEMVRRVSDAVIAAARPGITLAALQVVAQGAIPPAARPYMQAPLYFGHHLGLSSGDPFLADAMLAAGMVFTIEPWYYDHDRNIAVFIEDEILITASGSENLTAELPRDAAGLETLRKGRDMRSPPPALLGRFMDDYGNSFRVSPEIFEQLPRGRFRIVEWHAREQYFIAQNDSTNPGDAGLWTRIDWMPLDGMPPYVWGFCMTAYRAATAEAARATPAADRSAPRVGCGGYPFSRLRPR